MKIANVVFLASAALGICGCDNDDDSGTEADQEGVGAQCAADDDCLQPEDDTDLTQECLTQFKGGYCGIENCTSNEDCPEGSACVIHDDGVNYCFRQCLNKSECNINRSLDVEANCSANITFVDSGTNTKACVPPSG